MACSLAVAAAITNSCDTIPVAGLEKKAWIINRADITWTIDATTTNLITAAANASTKQAYVVTAVKKEGNAGADLVSQDNMPDTFLHYFSFQPFQKSASAIAQLDSMADIALILELKGEKEEGSFVVLGVESGLYQSGLSWRVNDNNGLPIYEFMTQEGQGEKYSRYVFWDTDYATTLAAIVALETPGV